MVSSMDWTIALTGRQGSLDGVVQTETLKSVSGSGQGIHVETGTELNSIAWHLLAYTKAGVWPFMAGLEGGTCSLVSEQRMGHVRLGHRIHWNIRELNLGAD